MKVSVVGEKVELVIMRHLVPQNHSSKVDFLGVYIEKDKALSDSVSGLLGKCEGCVINQSINHTNINSLDYKLEKSD